MGLLKKIGKGIKKFGSFTGKVVKGVASGGLVGGGAAFVSNLGGSSSKAQKKTFSAKDILKNSLPAVSVNVGLKDQDKKTLKIVGYIVGGLLALWLVVKFVFKRKR